MFGQRAHFSMFAPETVPYGIKRYEAQGEILDELCNRLLAGLLRTAGATVLSARTNNSGAGVLTRGRT